MGLVTLTKQDMVPRYGTKSHLEEFVKQRRQWLSKQTGVEFKHIASYSIAPEDTKGNIENFIGVTQVPLGIAGPIKVNGQYAKGIFYIPFATTEAVMLESYQRGMLVLTHSGGANAIIKADKTHISPVFLLKDITAVDNFIKWVKENIPKVKEKAESTTRYGKLIDIECYPIGRRAFLKFIFTTGDAMGLNMINMAVDEACKYILEETKAEKYFLRSNLSSDKKPSWFNFIQSYGKEVAVDATIPRKIISRYLNTTPEEMYEFWYSSALGCFQAGVTAINAQYANALTAIFIACGQDAAQVAHAAVGISMCEVTKEGDLYASLKIPALTVGTIGGGTSLGTQKECLQIMGCYGADKVKKFAEVIAAALLAGEISLCAALATGEFIQSHKAARIHAKEKSQLKST